MNRIRSGSTRLHGIRSAPSSPLPLLLSSQTRAGLAAPWAAAARAATEGRRGARSSPRGLNLAAPPHESWNDSMLNKPDNALGSWREREKWPTCWQLLPAPWPGCQGMGVTPASSLQPAMTTTSTTTKMTTTNAAAAGVIEVLLKTASTWADTLGLPMHHLAHLAVSLLLMLVA